MTPISDRFALPLLILLLAVAIPVWMNSGTARYQDDCVDPEAFHQIGSVPGTWRVTDREPRQNETRIQWTEAFALKKTERDPQFSVHVVRSYNPYYLFSKPKSVMPRRFSPDREATKDLATPWGDLPVHFDLRLQGSRIEVVAYAFFYRDRVIRNVFWGLVRSALDPLLGPTRPLTIALIHGSAPISKQVELQNRALSWFEGMAEHYWSTCHPDTPFASDKGSG